MKNSVSALMITALLLTFLLSASSVGCVCNVQGTEGNLTDTTTENSDTYISSVEDIKELVTDDEKLVINYYDSYTWVVFFGEDGSICDMIYIYDFESSLTAKNMLKTRTEQLQSNRSMKIINAYTVENCIVVELTDSSFEAVSREMLENNFEQLIVK